MNDFFNGYEHDDVASEKIAKGGSIKISPNVISTIAGIAAEEIEGVGGMYSSLPNTIAEKIGAKYYTFHGTARLKKLPININFDHVGKYINLAEDVCEKHGIKIAYENVHWCYYNYVGFFKELKKRENRLKGTFDIKQARLSGVEYKDFIEEMGSDIVTVHLSDIDENGKMCLPGKGITDFYDIFSRLNDVGFDGAMLIEVYKGDYEREEELFESLEYIKGLQSKIFNR